MQNIVITGDNCIETIFMSSWGLRQNDFIIITLLQRDPCMICYLLY